MLSHATLGLLALGVLWGNTLLIVWSTLLEVRQLFGSVSSSWTIVRILIALVLLLIGAAACTTLALWSPVFGPISTVGGMACLVFFLLVQPLGTALRDHARAHSPGRTPPPPSLEEGAHAPLSR